MSSHFLTADRVWACVLAVALTSFVGVLAKAFHPAGAATAMLIALGAFSTRADALTLVIGILIVGVCGNMVRHIRLGLHKARALRP
jgi:CBS-domain-containing membrane protein